MVRCSCGRVELAALGAPITSVVCYCDDCQEGSRRIAALPGAQAVREPDGGTSYVLYRKDRLQTLRGAEFLKRNKLDEKSATNRVVATCCGSAMFMSFDDSKHWVPVYRARFQGDAPPLEMRIQTKFRPAGSAIPDDVPCYPAFPFGFIGKLLAARVAMLLRR
ncbi:GFA family protein [Pyxidicoccus fallax]|uniref:GFA family protein n=1 Tax=Pyxidicoccus fallax TaxID=394095 RepID=UPI003F6DF437